jgi:hypothetical protein
VPQTHADQTDQTDLIRVGTVLSFMPINADDTYMIEKVVEVLVKRGFEIKHVFGEWVYTPHPEADLQPVLSFTITGVEAENNIVVKEETDTVRGVEITVRCVKTECVVDLEEYEEDVAYGVKSVLKSKRVKVRSWRKRAPVKALEKALDTLLSVYEEQSVGTQQSL